MRTVYFAVKDGTRIGIQAMNIAEYYEDGYEVFCQDFPDMGETGEPSEMRKVSKPYVEQKNAVNEHTMDCAECAASGN